MSTQTTYDIIEGTVKELRASQVKLEKQEKMAHANRCKCEKAFLESLAKLSEVEKELDKTKDTLILLEG